MNLFKSRTTKIEEKIKDVCLSIKAVYGITKSKKPREEKTRLIENYIQGYTASTAAMTDDQYETNFIVVDWVEERTKKCLKNLEKLGLDTVQKRKEYMAKFANKIPDVLEPTKSKTSTTVKPVKSKTDSPVKPKKSTSSSSLNSSKSKSTSSLKKAKSISSTPPVSSSLMRRPTLTSSMKSLVIN